MYWWDYATFQFTGMLVIGLLCGWAISEARAAGAPKRHRNRHMRARRALNQQFADLAAIEAGLALSLRRLEALERERADRAIIQVSPAHAPYLEQRGGEAA